MKKAVLLFFLALWLFSLPAFAAEVRNVTARQEGNRMLFEYDLVGDDREVTVNGRVILLVDDESDAEVQLTVTVKGQVYSMDKLHLEGDAGKVKVGKGKKIWWNVLRDFPRGVAGDVEWELTAGAKKFKDPTTGMEFVFVKGGCFQMGDTFGDGDKDEKPVHEVCVSDLYLGIYEVTQAQWERVMGSNPSHFKRGGNYPVEQVSWNDVYKYIERLNLQSGRKYGLHKEAEWEYAARSGGKKEKYAGTSQERELDQYAWYKNNSGNRTHPVGQKNPNGLGLYDMSGNVWEWCSDSYDENYYKISPKDNPRGPFVDPDERKRILRTLRGGAWYDSPGRVRAALRSNDEPAAKYPIVGVGFRLALSPE